MLRRASIPLLAALLALACALAATWPAASSPAGSILCNYVHPDCLSNHWLMVWVAEQLATGGSILHNDWYYWPVGDAPWLAGNGSEGFSYLPFHLIFGWPTASTVYLVGLLALNGFASYTLARSAGAAPLAALAAAPTGATMVYAIHELGAGRFSQVSFCWMAFFLAAWLRFCAAPSTGRGLLAALLLALTSLFYWYYGLFAVIAGAVLLVAHRRPPVRAPYVLGESFRFLRGFRPRTAAGAAKPGFAVGFDRASWGALATFSVAFLALIGPLLWVFLRYWSAIPGTGEETFPHPEAIGDSTWPGIPFLVSSGRHAGRALPFTTVVLAVVALWDKERRRVVLGLWALALVFAALMAGALLPHGPYEWVYGLAGPLRRFWWPYRHVIVLNLALTTLAALGAQRLLAWARLSRVAPWLLAGLALSIPLQLTLQGAAWQAQFSRADMTDTFYPQVRDLPGKILVEPPLAPGVAGAQTPLVYQLLHHKTLLSGHALWVERVRPAAWDTFVADNSFLTNLQRMERGELTTTFTFDPAHLRALLDAGALTWVVNQEYFPAALKPLVQTYDALFTDLFGEPAIKGKRVKAWDASRWDGHAEVTIPAFVWPSNMRFGGPTLALQAPRPPSVIFSIPAPPTEKKNPKQKR